MAKSRVLPAILASTESELEERLGLVRAWKTPVHLDIVDGRFARPKSAFGLTLGKLPAGSEAHLMVRQPFLWKKAILQWRPKTVLLHVESSSVKAMIAWATKHKMNVRLALKTTTPISAMTPFIKNISGVHVMLGSIGKYGSVLEEEMWLRVKYFAEAAPRGTISVDVGITPATWKIAQRYGATHASVGSYLFSQKNPSLRWKKFQNKL